MPSITTKQDTLTKAPLDVVDSLKSQIADEIVGHGTAWQASSMEELKPADGLVAEEHLDRFKLMGFSPRPSHISSSGKLKVTFKDLVSTLRSRYCDDGKRSPILTLGAAAEAINHTIVAWVAHPHDKTSLVVHQTATVHGGLLAIHSPSKPYGTIHLRFYNYSDETDPDVTTWGSGSQGHYELLRPCRDTSAKAQAGGWVGRCTNWS